jgi:WD40 repeat protein
MSDELVSPAVLAAFSADGVRLAGRAREDRTLVRVWEVASGNELAAFPGHTMPVLCVRFSPDGRWLVTCACDTDRPGRPHEINVWDAATGQCQVTRTGQGLLFTAAFSPEGRWLALGGQDGAVWLADWASSHPLMRLPGHKSHVAAIAFHPEGRFLASAGVDDKMIKIWELDKFDPTGPAAPPKVHTVSAPSFPCDLAFSPDGRRLAGISRDAVKMWDVATRYEVLSLRGARQRYWDPAFNPRLAFSPDGNRLVGSNWDESISMWDAGVPDDENVVAAQQAARRQAADARAAFWHLEEAEDCRDHHNRSAARFHLERLGDTPLPPPLQARKERLAQDLAK